MAKASVSGHGTNVIQGLAMSLESTALPALVIIVGIIVTYSLAGLFGIAIATTTMLSLAGFIVALDAFGPVTDNAGGIAEMAGLPPEVRVTTDALDAVGNTTKAVTKGYAIGSAGLGALVLFAAYTEDLKYFSGQRRRRTRSSTAWARSTFDLSNPYVVVGLLFGGLLPFLFGGMSMTAVGRAAEAVVSRGPPPVPREPRHHDRRGQAGVRPRRRHPDQGGDQGDDRARRCCRCCRRSCCSSSISAIAGKVDAFAALGAMLMGVIVTGLFVAISMTSGGGAWDNAKKVIEEGTRTAARAPRPTRPP